ncbi:MAG TPA: PDZ domain-containing protein [Pyrinomonadaceae bacterium]|nr:PDZ domain-containing protein [Pyrinomonadaceae bacterium]
MIFKSDRPRPFASRALCAPLALACAFVCAHAQQQQPARPAATAKTLPTATTPTTPKTQVTSTVNGAASTVSVQVRPARARVAKVARPARPSSPPVVAVVHRMSGWKLRALVAPPDAPIAATFDDKFVSTNIVAGYVMPDGYTVVARLPQAEADVLSFATTFPDMKPPGAADDSPLKLVRGDGAEFDAKFVGLDASTGLSLFESDKLLLSPTRESMQPLSVGLRVCVWAPLRAVETSAAVAVSQANSPDAPVGDSGVLYMNMSEVEGRLREVVRTPGGRAMSFRVEVEHVSPEWAGGVALTEGNSLIGIVEQGAARGANLLPADSVRAAAARVKARRASVPQPWLGARGTAVATTPPELFVERGWSREQGLTLMRRQQGVLLTAVAPGTPAARAGLRPGDVVARVGDHDVRGVEDMTWVLKELGGNTPAQFTVLRAGAAPLSLRVRLSESQNPALETSQAEIFATEAELMRAQSSTLMTRAKILETETELRRLEAQNPASGDEQRRVLREKLRAAEESYRGTVEGVNKLQRQLVEAQSRFRAATAAHPTYGIKPLLPYGVESAAFISTRTADGVTESRRGLLVVAVHAGSVMERAGVRVGDLIETVNGEPSLGAGWQSKLQADPKTEIALGVLRDGKRLALKLRPPASDK